jgi:hypothetical protein
MIADNFNARRQKLDDKRNGKTVVICGQQFPIRRVIWKLVYGYDPKKVFHRNHDPEDTRLENLTDIMPKGYFGR